MYVNLNLAQLAEAVEYADCVSAARYTNPTKKCPVYDTKPSDGEAPILDFGECGISLHCYYYQVNSYPEW